MGRTLLYSEDSESGEVLRKRFRGSSRDEDEELDVAAMRGKRKHKSWNDPEASSSYSSEVSAWRFLKHVDFLDAIIFICIAL